MLHASILRHLIMVIETLLFFQETPPILSSNKTNIHPLENIPSPISVLDAMFCQDGLSPLRSISNSFQGENLICQTILHTSPGTIVRFPSIQKPYWTGNQCNHMWLVVQHARKNHSKLATAVHIQVLARANQLRSTNSTLPVVVHVCT